MSLSLFYQYRRTLALGFFIAMGIVFALSEWRVDLWSAALPLFERMETTPPAVVGKTWGAVFAGVEAVHLLAMAVLGGAVLLSDANLMGLALREQAMAVVQNQCHRVFVGSLLLVILTGVLMVCSVALKVYYLEVFWYKMLALSVGVIFVFALRRPLLANTLVKPAANAKTHNLGNECGSPIDRLHVPSLPVRCAIAISSVMIWFSVAATGRWIGFSG